MIEVGGTIRMTWKSKVCLWFYNRLLVFNKIGQWFINHVDMEETEYTVDDIKIHYKS